MLCGLLTFWSASEWQQIQASGLAMETLEGQSENLLQLTDSPSSRMPGNCPGWLWHAGLMCQAAAAFEPLPFQVSETP